ncbi:hypothetical protein KM043_007449 [Ampulex compressa]|nr:hypothetical protein KM043_007449 [Ampulex compressa]
MINEDTSAPPYLPHGDGSQVGLRTRSKVRVGCERNGSRRSLAVVPGGAREQESRRARVEGQRGRGAEGWRGSRCARRRGGEGRKEAQWQELVASRPVPRAEQVPPLSCWREILQGPYLPIGGSTSRTTGRRGRVYASIFARKNLGRPANARTGYRGKCRDARSGLEPPTIRDSIALEGSRGVASGLKRRGEGVEEEEGLDGNGDPGFSRRRKIREVENIPESSYSIRDIESRKVGIFSKPEDPRSEGLQRAKPRGERRRAEITHENLREEDRGSGPGEAAHEDHRKADEQSTEHEVAREASLDKVKEPVPRESLVLIHGGSALESSRSSNDRGAPYLGRGRKGPKKEKKRKVAVKVSWTSPGFRFSRRIAEALDRPGFGRRISTRGAVGGCSTPGSRVDPWWNPGSLFSSTPGPPRSDEGPPAENLTGGFQFCGLPTRATGCPSQQPHGQHQHPQEQRHRPHQVQSSLERNVRAGHYGHASSPSCSSSSLGHLKAACRADVVASTAAASLSSAPPPGAYEIASPSRNLVLSALLASTSSAATEEKAHQQPRGPAASHAEGPPSSSAASSQHRSTATTADSLNGVLSSLNVRIKTEEFPKLRPEERRAASAVSHPSSSSSSSSSTSTSCASSFNASLLSSLLSTSRISAGGCRPEPEEDILSSRSCAKQLDYPRQSLEPDRPPPRGIKLEYAPLGGQSSREVLGPSVEGEELAATSPYDIVKGLAKQPGRPSIKEAPPNVVTAGNTLEMKYETQPGPPAAPPHLSSSGVEPPHSSQGSGIVVAGSPADVGVDSLLLSPWGATGPDFLEPPDVKQTAAGLQDAWDTLLLGSSVGVASAQSLAELKPLPPFTGYTGHLSINGIPGHHYHAIASSGQRPSLPSSSPTPSSNQEYYESPVVSSSTPCPQASQKQQLPQSTQQVDYDIEDIAEIIGSAIADTTVPGGGNGPGSEHDPDASRDWIDIAEWIDTACSPKAQETGSPSPYSQIYATPSAQAQQHGSTLQSLLTHGYAPLLQARLQAGNAGLQNASCGETPSSTSPYPPVSPPGRVSTSCSPDHLLHSSFAAPSHPRKRSRPAPSSQNPSKKSPNAGATALPYGTESGLIGGKEKPVHRCSICNRGFLNKSNIKVHLRTHTGEKPFRCEVCGKAFRQKAHLIKHQQIHKRIGRD